MHSAILFSFQVSSDGITIHSRTQPSTKHHGLWRDSEIRRWGGEVMRLKDDYMQSQQDVTEKMRMILVDWLVEVPSKRLLVSKYELCYSHPEL